MDYSEKIATIWLVCILQTLLFLFPPISEAQMERIYIVTSPSRSYGCLNFAFDIFMCLITGGLWLIWIFVREMRRR